MTEFKYINNTSTSVFV